MLATSMQLSTAYLLVAQPQSSSTATMLDLAHLSGFKAKQEFPCSNTYNRPTCNSSSPSKEQLPCKYAKESPFYRLARGHSDICVLTPEIINEWVRSNHTIFKQHLAPSPHNLRLLLDAARRSPRKRVVLLTRSVLGSAHALCERNLHPSLGSSGGRRLAGVDPSLATSMLAWQRGWLTAASSATGREGIWTFSYEQMEGNGRSLVLSDALNVLGLRQKARFGGSNARLINQTDTLCTVAAGELASSEAALRVSMKSTVGFHSTKRTSARPPKHGGPPPPSPLPPPFVRARPPPAPRRRPPPPPRVKPLPSLDDMLRRHKGRKLKRKVFGNRI